MNNNRISEKLNKLLVEELHIAAPNRDTDLINEGYLDSLLFLNLLLELEREFGITIQYEEVDFDNFRTINTIVDFVGERTEHAVISQQV